MAVTAKQVKELRELTGAGMMDCKKALVETDGNIEEAIDWLRKNGIAKNEKKAGRVAAEGLSKVVIDGNKAVIVEMNSETDFVAKNEAFLALLDKTARTLLASGVKTVDEALALTADGTTLNDTIINAVATIGEKITLRRFEIIEKADDEIFGDYMHQGGRISALCVLKGTSDGAVAHNIAMQIASMSPTYVSRRDMPQEVVEKERSVQQALVDNDEKLANKPEKVKAGIVEGKVSKALKDMCLVDQEFFLDTDMTCGTYLKNNGAETLCFVKYVVGEGIAKKEDNFAAEVAAAAFGK